MVDFRTENRIDVLRQAGMLLDKENQRLHKRLQALLTELAQVKGQTPAELQQELIALQELPPSVSMLCSARVRDPS